MSHLLWEKLAAQEEFQHNDWQPYQIDDYQDGKAESGETAGIVESQILST